MDYVAYMIMVCEAGHTSAMTAIDLKEDIEGKEKPPEGGFTKQGPELHAPLFRNLVLSIKTAIILSSQKLLFAQ